MTVGVSSTNTADVWLNWYRGTNATAPTAIWVKLHTADPGAAGATAAAAGDTTRKQATFAAPSGTTPRAIALSANVTGWVNGGTSETITHVSVWDASSAGNFLHSAALTASQAWVSTNTFTLTSLGVNLSPIAA
jgi:hypothetical protein